MDMDISFVSVWTELVHSPYLVHTSLSHTPRKQNSDRIIFPVHTSLTEGQKPLIIVYINVNNLAWVSPYCLFPAWVYSCC